MSKIVVLGAGVCGLAAGLLLRRDGHDVTVVERDPDPVPSSPEEAWERWSREGVTQFRLAHYLTPRGRIMLEEALPDVLAGLEAAGGIGFDPLPLMPPSITDRTPRAGDDRFRTVTARRPVLEQVLAEAADAETGLEIRRGVSVAELVLRAGNGTPHVTGVRTESGEQLDADLIVDAMGRRSQLPRWLEAAGTRPVHEEAEDSGFIYYSRFFRATSAGMPELPRPVVDTDRDLLAAHAAIRQRHLVGDGLHRRGRQAAEAAARSRAVDGAGAGLPAACAMARGRSDQ